jgi:hypothetical protein
MEFLLITDQLVAGTTPKSSKIIEIMNEFYTISLSIHKLIKNLLPVCVGSLIMTMSLKKDAINKRT